MNIDSRLSEGSEKIVKCIFYQNSSDNRKVNKNLSVMKTVDCNVKESSTMENPTVILGRETLSEVARANYAYIDTFQRYYYINDVTVSIGGLIEVHMSIDVLQSFAPSIKSLVGVIERNEYLHSDYIQDSELPTRTQRIISYHYVGAISSENNIFLTVNGGDIA